MAGILDYLSGNYPAPGAQPSPNDPTGAYLGGLLDPNTAAQFQAARAQQALAGLAAGFGTNSGASRLPVTDLSVMGGAINGMNQAQNALPQQALQSAQAANQITENQLNKLKTLQTSYLVQNMPGAFAALKNYYGGQGQANGQQPPVNLLSGPLNQNNGNLSGNAVSSTTADTSLPPAARALLDTIAGPESSGKYDVRWGGPNKTDVKFDSFAQHPNIPEPGPKGPSTAAGRYQIVNSTWTPIQKQMGLPDFSPVSQDQAAWNLASTTYQGKTGRDLLGDLNSGNLSQVGPALAGQWATLNRAMPNYSANLQKYLPGGQGATGQATPNNLPAVPNYGNDLSQQGQYAPGLMPSAAGGGANGFAITPQNVRQAQMTALALTQAGMPVPDDLKAMASAGIDMAKKDAEFNSRYGAQAKYAGPEAGAKAAATAPYEMVNTIVNGVEMQVPKNVYMGGPAAIARYGAGMSGQPNGLLAQPQAPQANAPQGLLSPNRPIPPMQAPQGASPNAGSIIPQQAPTNNPQGVSASDYTPQEMALAQQRGMLMSNGLPSFPPNSIGINSKGYQYNPSPLPPDQLQNENAAMGAISNGTALWQNGIRGALGLPTGAQGSPAATAGTSQSPSPANAPQQASVAPMASPGGSNMPLVGKPAGPFGYSYSVPHGTGPGQDSPQNIMPSADHPYATVMPGLNEQSTMRASSPAAFDEMQKGWNDQTTKMAEALPDIQTSKQLLNSMADIFKRYQSGSFAEHMSDMVADMKAAGINVSSVNNPADMQQLLKDNFNEAIAKMKATGIPRFTQLELKMAGQNFANPNLQPAANFNVTSQDLGKINQAEAFTQDWMTARRTAGGPMNLQDFENAWFSKNPLQSFVDRAKVQIGPFAGMSQKDIDTSMPNVKTSNGQQFVISGGRPYPIGGTQ